jgi:hypothetical protein
VLALIDFKDEINKYKPVLSMEDVESAVKDEVQDMMYLLQYITDQMKEKSKEE